MLGFISKIFGGSKSEKDVKKIEPYVGKINQFFTSYQSLSNDQLRNKTQEFRQRIKEHLTEIDAEISEKNAAAEALPFTDLMGKDGIYQEVDKLKKERDKKIEEVLEQLLPEAFAVVKETSRRFKENTDIIATATQLDRDLMRLVSVDRRCRFRACGRACPRFMAKMVVRSKMDAPRGCSVGTQPDRGGARIESISWCKWEIVVVVGVTACQKLEKGYQGDAPEKKNLFRAHRPITAPRMSPGRRKSL